MLSFFWLHAQVSTVWQTYWSWFSREFLAIKMDDAEQSVQHGQLPAEKVSKIKM
jgi:hypothetical protein